MSDFKVIKNITVMNNKRLKLGIIFKFSPSWMGGVIYVINLVKALNRLPDSDKPEIFLFYRPELKEFLDEFDYPYISLIESKALPVYKNFLVSWMKRKNVFVDDLIEKYSLDAIYPVKNFPIKSKTNANVVAWYADLQHKYYPEFFKKSILIHRAFRTRFMLRNADQLVVSSRAVKDDFHKFFKIRPDLKFHIYHFVSINDDFNDVTIEELKKKYKLPDKYFMVSNQFHKHKNHKVLLLALAKLKEMGIKKHIAMTGKFPDAKYSPYISELHDIINKYSLHDRISFLGLIPRKDQMQLMNHCQAVIQPSLFEGWSTVIEDAISIQVPVIASTLPVNIEQLEDKGTYFDPHDVDKLVSILKDYPDRKFGVNIYGDYSVRIKEAIGGLLQLFKS